MNATTVPDTVVQLFDVTPEVTFTPEIAPVSEVSFFSDPLVSLTESSDIVSVSPVAEVAFFNAPKFTSDDNKSNILETISEIQAPTEAIAEQPESIISSEVMDTEVLPVFDIAQLPVPDKNDIYAPMKRAIAEYENFLTELMKDAEIKDQEIIDYNGQIAEAKKIAKLAIDKAQASAKEALEKRKNLDAEMKRIQEMSNLLSLQIQSK